MRMNLLTGTVISLSLLLLAFINERQEGAAIGARALTLAGHEASQTMQIKRSGSQPSETGSAEYFTGAVRIDPLFPVTDPSRTSGASVTFEPGAHSAWHTHPLGQHLVVTAGRGWIQQEGGERQEIRPGDVVWTPANVRHWHGATTTTAMTHIAIQESLDGTSVVWMEKVSEEQYGR
jgi:quercetin dioxygenase-like cupin family protein